MSERLRRLSSSAAAAGQRAAVRAVILCLGWWALNEGELAGLGIGGVGVVVALSLSMAISPSGTRWQVGGLARFAVRFLIGSVRGGIDVAWRALARSLPLSPTLVRYRLRLTTPAARQLFAGAISLMPGTLSVALDDQDLEVHLLVDDPRASGVLEDIERSVARATGEALEASHG